MTRTTYFNLKKPASSDYVNIADLNDNADLTDAALHDLDQRTQPISKGGTGAATAAAARANLGVAAAEDAVRLRLAAEFRTAGTFTWTCPEDGSYVALIIGGGGGGPSTMPTGGNASRMCGGGSGYWAAKIADYEAGDQVSGVVGSGGAVDASISSMTTKGGTGGTSSFGGETAIGGDGGVLTRSSVILAGAAGGQPSRGDEKGIYGAFGGVTGGAVGGDAGQLMYGTPIPAVFVDARGLPVCLLCAGCAGTEQAFPLPNGNTMAAAGSAVAPTDPGAGGSAPANVNSIIGSAGAPGAVFIYKILEVAS